MDKGPSTLVASLLLLGGLAILGFGLYYEGDALGLRDRATEVEGTVVGISRAHGNRTVGRSTMTMQFTTPGGKIAYIQSGIASGEHHLGEKIGLLFDPKTRTTVIDSMFEVYGLLLWFGVTGAVLALVGAMSLLAARRARAGASASRQPPPARTTAVEFNKQ
jgi:hypothetical protein